MKNLFAFLSLTTLFFSAVGCKKTGNSAPVPQNTASIIGEYSLNGTQTFTTNGKSSTSKITNATLYVMQTDKANVYYFLERYGTQETGGFVTMNGQDFVCEKIVDESFPDDRNRWIGYRTGNGSVSGTTINYQVETPGFNIQNVYINYPTNIIAMSRRTILTATKK